MDNSHQQGSQGGFSSRSSQKLTPKQLQHYQQLGYIRDIEVLSKAELSYFRHHLMLTCNQLGGDISRLDGAHAFFPWAWQLCCHPAILNIIRQLIGDEILIKSTRFFYKHANTDNFVGWHQDGFTEQESGANVPTIWLGLTDSSAESGCLQLIPGSHKLGLLPHPKVPNACNLTYGGTTAQTAIENVTDIEMPAGFMSVHHPLTVHGSQANISTMPRIGFSASYATPALQSSISPVAQLAGKAPLNPALQLIYPPGPASTREAISNYRLAYGKHIRRIKEQPASILV